MAKVPLRTYNKEIDALIDQGHVDEAIAHCQHILKTYPKNLETYRLLGKAYLEQHRYKDAGDIFGRILLAMPDDFVSNLGMSVISDEQKELDHAIWHMERAFEAQPSNQGIVGELRRLYGRRDGMEPPKIRLTRGALAQMYAKGEQYAQAIAEIKSVLASEPDRADMQVLLARCYFQQGQKVDATEACNTLLKRYPYVLDANRILVEILPGTAKADSVGTFRSRVNALDPYAALATKSVFLTDEVPDNAVVIERLDYDAIAHAKPASQPGWGSSTPEPVAESPWASNSSLSQPSFETSPAIAANNIPDWMKSAGWGESSGAATEEPNHFDEEATPSAPDAEQANIPDWLKSMAPPGTGGLAMPSIKQEESNAEADMDFLNALNLPGGGTSQPSAQNNPPDWLADLGAAGSVAEGAVAESSFPDWLSGGFDRSTPAPSAKPEADDWLKNLDQAPAPTSAEPASDIPDWLSGLSEPESAPAPQASIPPAAQAEPSFGMSASDQDDALAWLESLAAKQGAKPEELLTKPSERKEEAPAWVSQVPHTPVTIQPSAPEPYKPEKPIEVEAQEPEALSPKVAGPGTSSSEQDDALAWLESLAAKQGANPEEFVTKPSERKEEAPSWVAQVQNPPTDLSAPVLGPGMSSSDQDDALAWLESLAAKQGAKPEELLTKPAERKEEAPSWVNEVAQAPAPKVESKPEPTAEQPTSDLSELITAPGTSTSDQDDAMAWLESLAAKQGARPEELLTKPTERKDDAPSWVNEVAQAPAPKVEAKLEPTAEQPASDLSELITVPDTSKSDQDDAMAWLESLAAKQGANPEELLTKPDERKEEAPDWISDVAQTLDQAEKTAEPKAEEDTLSWLSDLEKQAPSAEEPLWKPAETPVPEPVASGSDITDWLKALDEKQEQEPDRHEMDVHVDASAIASSDVPGWLKEMDEKEKAPAGDDLPEWLKDQSEDDRITPEPQAMDSKWIPAESVIDRSTTAKDFALPEEFQAEAVTPISDIESEPPLKAPASLKFEAPPPKPESRIAKPKPITAVVTGDRDGPILKKAQEELAKHNLGDAMQEYSRLIKKGKLLEEVIYDLREATYKHPVDVIVWQTLGDAYMRSNRLQDALDSYTKAEELLR